MSDPNPLNPTDPQSGQPSFHYYLEDGSCIWEGSRWVPVADPLRLRRIIDFEFEVGDRERHRVRYRFNQFWGGAWISVDGKRVERHIHLLSFSLVRPYRLTVGQGERHTILIERIRKLTLAGARPQFCRVYIDGRLLAAYGP